MLALLVRTPGHTAPPPVTEIAEDRRPQAEPLLDPIRRSFTESFGGQRLRHQALKVARQFGEDCAASGVEVSGLIGPLLQACREAGKARQPQQQRQTEILTRAVEAYLAARTRQLAEQAQRDALTRLFNRAVLDQRLPEELARAHRYGRALALVLCDLDQFKQVNDRLGHPAGDAVLQQFANLLQASLRQSDVAFRYGGDEFAALLPETASAAAEQVIQRLQERLRLSLHTPRLSEPLGLSFGIAAFPADADSAPALLQVADARLYECKRARPAAARPN